MVKRILATLIALVVAAAAEAGQVTVFAAASLATAVDEIAARFAVTRPDTVRASYAASSALAKQIENGAPAQIFISADPEWMDYLAGKGLIEPASRFDLVGNALVLVAPADAPLPRTRIAPDVSIARLAGDARIATGDPDHVPVGKYARRALESLGQWQEVAPKLARADNVRAALALVERGEVALGVVYASDAAASDRVKVVAEFPERLHPPIVYPAALVAGAQTPAARLFLDFLRSAEARAVFARHGFRTE